MPEWWIERGIGETRAVQVEQDEIVEARILRDGVVPSGTVLTAKLKLAAPRNAVAMAEGQEYLLPRGAPRVTEGAKVSIEVTREAIGGDEPWKRPLARIADRPTNAPPPQGRELAFPATDDPLEQAGWSDLIDEARTGLIDFAGGQLRVSVTPAMTLIDVDGPLPPAELTVAGIRAAARAIRRHGIAGSIGIDLPAREKPERLAAAEWVDRILPQPFERTAVNGFGFIQIVRPRRHASLFELASDRPAFEARALLRRAARCVGAMSLVAHPAVIAAIPEAWTDALGHQVGGAVRLRGEASLAMAAGYAEPS